MGQCHIFEAFKAFRLSLYLVKGLIVSLYAEYLKHTGTKKILENEWGFATYLPYKDGIYLEDIYVQPGLRKGGLAKEFHEQVIQITKDLGLKKIYGSVVPAVNPRSATNPTEMVKWMFGQGYTIDECLPGILVLVKEI